MFEKRKAEKAARAQADALASWTQERDGYAHLLDIAKGFAGSSTNDIMLKSGEALFYSVTGTALIEDRMGKGTYQGKSAGVSIPIGSVHGRSVRYRVGATRGHYVQGAPVATAVDRGTTYITNQRVVFAGAKQTRECIFAKLIGASRDDGAGETTFSVSNRQKPTTIHYGPALSGNFNFRLELALAHFKGTVSEMVAQMKTQLAQIDAERPGGALPAAPSGVAPTPQAAAPPPPLAPPPLPPPRLPVGTTADVVPPPDHEGGWEYLYLASELSRGLSLYQGLYGEYQSQIVAPTGEHIADPAANVRLMASQISDVVAAATGALSAESLERAFGPPGSPGDEAAIRDVANQLVTAFGQLAAWGIKVRNSEVDPAWQPAYLALSKYVGLPLHQFQDFSAAFSAATARVVAELRAGQTPTESITLSLIITIDPNATAEFNAALEALKRAK